MQLDYYSYFYLFIFFKKSCELFSVSHSSPCPVQAVYRQTGVPKGFCALCGLVQSAVSSTPRESSGAGDGKRRGEKKSGEKKTGSTHGKNGSTLRGKCRVESLRHCREGFFFPRSHCRHQKKKKREENKVCVLSGHDAENAQGIERKIKKKTQKPVGAEADWK